MDAVLSIFETRKKKRVIIIKQMNKFRRRRRNVALSVAWVEKQDIYCMFYVRVDAYATGIQA